MVFSKMRGIIPLHSREDWAGEAANTASTHRPRPVEVPAEFASLCLGPTWKSRWLVEDVKILWPSWTLWIESG